MVVLVVFFDLFVAGIAGWVWAVVFLVYCCLERFRLFALTCVAG